MKSPLTALCGCLLLAFSGNLPAALLAHYDFGDGDLTDNEAGSAHPLTHIQTNTAQVGLSPIGFASFPGDDDDLAYLEASGAGAQTHFTVSFWWRTDSFDQGSGDTLFQGIYSSNSGSGNYRWQFDSHGTDMRLASNDNNLNADLLYSESNLSTDTWYHTVIRKDDNAGNNKTQVYITEYGSSQVDLVMNSNQNPGALHKFRLGIDRETENAFRFDMANVKIYDDATVNLNNLLAEGPSLIPEPGQASALLGLIAAGFLLRRRPS